MQQPCRGVFEAIWHGPHRETVLVVVTGSGLKLEEVTVPLHLDPDVIADQLREYLDVADPLPMLSTPRSTPRWRLVGRAPLGRVDTLQASG